MDNRRRWKYNLMKTVAMLALLLAGCRHTRTLDAEEQAIVDHARDLQAAAEMLSILTAGRAVGYGQPMNAE